MTQGHAYCIPVEDGRRKHLVMLLRAHRSKWFQLHCVCSGYRRKDGTCKHERRVYDALKPEIRARTRIVP